MNSIIITFSRYNSNIIKSLSAWFGTLSILSHATIVEIPIGIGGASLTIIFTAATGVVKKLLNVTRKNKKKNNKKIALARSKLDIIQNLISQALTIFDISHEEFSKIIYENNNYEQIRDNIRNAKSINNLSKENDQITP